MTKWLTEAETIDLDSETLDLIDEAPLTEAELMADEEVSAETDAEEVAGKLDLARALESTADVTSPITITCFDAERIADGPTGAGWQSEIWWRERDVLTVIRQCAPAGEYEVWQHSGSESTYAEWCAGKFGTGWTSQPHLRVEKDANGNVHVRAFKAEQIYEERWSDDDRVGFPW